MSAVAGHNVDKLSNRVRQHVNWMIHLLQARKKMLHRLKN